MKTLLTVAACLAILAAVQGQSGTFEAADHALNEAYRATIKNLSPQAGVALRESQRIWITLRDANAAYAASMASGAQAGLRITDLLERHFVVLRIGAGAAVLGSSTAQQQSLEAAEVNNGLFTAAVLSGLREHKADLNGDGVVRVSELLRFSQEEVRRLSGGLQEPVSRHVNLAEDFSVITYR